MPSDEITFMSWKGEEEGYILSTDRLTTAITRRHIFVGCFFFILKIKM